MHRSSNALAAAAFALGAFAFAGCSSDEPAAGAPPVETAANLTARVETIRLAPGTFNEVVELSGAAEATDDAVLSAQTAGTVTSLLDLGRAVGRGTVVAQVDPSVAQAGVQSADAVVGAARSSVAQAQAGVASAQANLDLAEDNFGRQSRLYADSIISATEFNAIRTQRANAQAAIAQARAAVAQAQAGVAQAEAGRRQASTNLGNTRITAPFAGVVEEHLVPRGSQVNPGTPVARVVARGRIKVRAGIPERYAGAVRLGDAVDARFSAFPNETFTGRITFVGASLEASTRTFPIEVEIGNGDNRLKPAMAATLAIRRTTIPDVLVVPRAALVRTEDGRQAVFVVTRTDSGVVARQRVVTLGTTSSAQAIIEEGLEAGEEVVVSGGESVADGDAVQAEAARPAAPARRDTARAGATATRR